MKEFGLDPDELRKNGRLAISNYDEIYIVDGQVNTAKIMTKFSDLTQKYRSMGLDGMRAAAEMSCFLREGKVRELMMYEYALHRQFKFPAEGICAYNILELQKTGHLDKIMPMIRAHDTAILAGPEEWVILDPMKAEDDDVHDVLKVPITA